MASSPDSPTKPWRQAVREVASRYKPAWFARMKHPYPEQFSEQLDLPPYMGTPRCYLIATTPRCGSHFLGHALHASGAFGFPLEYVNQMNLDIWQARFQTKTDIATIQALFRVRTSPSGWFGLKAHWTQWSRFEDVSFFENLGGFEKAIWIYRRDLLAQSISRSVAEQTGQWISGAKRRRDPVYDAKRIIRNGKYIRRQNEAWQAFLTERFDAPVHVVEYEDLLADQTSSFEAIGRFLDPDLGIAPIPPKKTKKQADGVSREWYERFRSEAEPAQEWIFEPQSFSTSPVTPDR